MIKVHTLANGLRIILEDLPFVRSVSFGIWVRNGSRDESVVTSGMSHFIEHMLFKGTHKRSAFEIADTMDAVGGQLNAFTAKEYTCYFSRTLDTHFDVALDVLSDMFFNSKFDQGDIEKECGVILEEISMYEDTPEDLCVDLLNLKAFPQSQLGAPILGTRESISGFKSQDFKNFISDKYHPKNVVIAVAGNFNEEEILAQITDVFKDYKDNSKKVVQEAASYSPGFSVKDKDIEQVHLCMGLPGITSGSEDSYALAAVNAILGGGMSSRLFQTIREQRGLAYSVYSYNASFHDTGIFVIYAALNPSQIYDVLHIAAEEIRGMFTNKITEEQLAKTKEQLKSGFLLSLENAASRMNNIGRTLLMLEKVITPDELVAKIDAVSMDTFYGIAEKILKLDQMSISLVGKNVEGMKFDEIRNACD